MLLYKSYDQAALDSQFNNRLRVPGYASYFESWEQRNLVATGIYSITRDIAYGNLPRERLDIFPASSSPAPVLVFIHGGYWHTSDKSNVHFIAPAFVQQGMTVVFINYPFASSHPMDQVVKSCRQALEWIYNNIQQYNGDASRLYIAGYSAGGHLASMIMAADWCHFNKRLDRGFVKGVCTLSGMFNLEPVGLSELNAILKLDEETMLRNSPAGLCPVISCPLLIAVGGDESEEFKDQSAELYDAWKSEKVPARLLSLPGVNHYSILDAFADKESVLHQAVLEMVYV